MDSVSSVSLPKVPRPVSITLPGGTAISSVVDISMGVPDDLTASFNLMTQLGPAMGSMNCLIRVLNAMKKLQEFMGGFTSLPPSPDPSKAQDLLSALGDLSDCFLAVTPAGVAPTIRGGLETILTVINGLIPRLEAIAEQQSRIAESLEKAGDNPELRSILEEAQANADLYMQHLTAALGPIQPLLDILSPLAEIANIPLDLPSIDQITNERDMSRVRLKLEDFVSSAEQVVGSL